MDMREEHKASPSKLNWMARTIRSIDWLKGWIRLIPAWVPANLITVLRALFLVPIFFVYQGGHSVWVFLLFTLAWFTDILDGLHARYRHQNSSLGKLLDPAVDKIFVVGLLWLLAPGRLSLYIVLVTVALELAIVLLTVCVGPISAHFLKRRLKIGANVWGKIKMFLHGCGLVALTLGLGIRALQVFSEVLFWSAAGFAVISIVFYIKSMEISD
jgi:CDP-diacylglycerol--glycerol-3-phosphate 3-phosphatidyltransferase